MLYFAQIRARGGQWRTVGVAPTRAEAAHVAALVFASSHLDQAHTAYQVRVIDRTHRQEHAENASTP
jgi:hypothetical protein